MDCKSGCHASLYSSDFAYNFGYIILFNSEFTDNSRFVTYSTGAADGRVRVAQLDGLKVLNEFHEHTDTVWCLQFNASGDKLVSVSKDKCPDSMLPKKAKWLILCRNVRKLLLVSDRHPEVYEHFRSYPSVVANRQRQLYEEGTCLIHPFSLFCLIWNSCMIFINLTHIILSSLRLCYILEPLPCQSKIQTADKVLLCFHTACLFDIIAKLQTGYHEEPGCDVQMSRSNVAWRYIRRWCVVDLMSSLPIAYILLHQQIRNCRYILMAHCMPLLKILRIWTILDDLRTCVKVFTSSYIWQGSLRHMVIFLLSAHLCSCLLYICPVVCYYWHGVLPQGYLTFLKMNNANLTDIPLSVRYQKGIFIYFSAFFGTAFSMYRVYEADEVIVNSLIILYAALYTVYAGVFLIKVYFTKFNSTIRYHELMNQVEEYMRHKQFPPSLKKRVITFYNYNFQEKYFKEDAALDYLSEQLRNEVTMNTCYKLVNKAALFDGLSATVVGTVLGCLRPEVYLPDDLVVRAGDIGDCMYFIANGTVAVYSLKGVEICHLEDGAHFGEVALLMKDSKRVASVVAIEITQVYRLDAADFRHYVMTNQELHERIEVLASQRMHETVLLDESFKSKTKPKQDSPLNATTQ
ncbi:potassium/sodium hyperpolarization-activated cyclic nucleotide-gated channel 3-like [Achroia grisella]|uniref:potassium/sodium hyperpolarization-activated cyclic nucleotide-gated channel 3-like n=1 Tax=Achroia grisella TaxID=688607 RepID=UPI0027D2D604|nr:potassium/sodium hyperpolarization-activated cyclic nucleotide-gated channel 3-like [Achroia grisella]